MTVSTLEGHADLRAFGIEQTAYAGTQVSIPLTADLKPSGPPSPPQPYDLTQVNQLPTVLLARSVTAAEPMTHTEIQERLTQEVISTVSTPGDNDSGTSAGLPNPNPGSSDSGSTLPTNPGGPDTDGGEPVITNPEPGDPANPDAGDGGSGGGGSNNGDDCPGNSCNAPGQGGSCPGNSCNAPGQNKGGKGKGNN